jgi:hypothetical protein
MLIRMDIDGLFYSPEDRIAAFSQAQVHLYRQDTSLQDYFIQLQTDPLHGPRSSSRDRRPTRQLVSLAVRSADWVSRLNQRRRIKTDVLFCPIPYFGRKTENQLLARTLLGLAQTDAKILCLLPGDSPCKDELNAQLEASGHKGQVEFIDPAEASNSIEARTRVRMSRTRGRSAFEKVISILEPHGLSPSPEVEGGFEHIAHFVEAWEHLEPTVEFDAVVARCHWHALCSPVCRTARQRGKPVITFQQGVIGHTLDVPLTASKFVAFGQPSAKFLAQANDRFFQACDMTAPKVDYVKGGSLFDTIIDLPDQFDLRTLLIVDVPGPQDDFYGVENQSRALIQLADRLLSSDPLQCRVVIRPHPFWNGLDFEACQRLVRRHPNRCELSHPAWSLEDDLRRSSAVAGIFSGVLTVSSACGLPTYFLQTEQGYTTGDLACFVPDQTLPPDEAFCKISRIMTDRRTYAEARAVALRNGREYYADGTNASLDARFFERLLQTEPAISRTRMS